MNLYDTSDALFDMYDLKPYMDPTAYSSSSGESSSDLEPSVTPVDIKPIFFDNFDNFQAPEIQIKKESVAVPPDTCLVCGEPTKCCHYDVPSCSGCKTFFRRTVISGKIYTCKNNGNCNIKGKDRCRQCRFDQCILAGMNPAGIKLPENIDLTEVVERIESRKRTLMNDLEPVDATNLPPSSSTTPESMSVVPVKMASIKLPQIMEFRDVDFLLFLEMKVRQLRESTYQPEHDGMPYTLQSIIESRTELGNADHYPLLSEQQDSTYAYGGFCKEQVDKLAEMENQHCHHRRKNWIAVDIFLSIEMAKTMPVFEQLTYADKEAFILNAALSTSVLTKSYYSHVQKSDAVIYPDGSMPIWIAKVRNHELTKLDHEVCVRMVQPVKRIDLTKEEYVLLKAIILCNPACKNISDAGQQLLAQESERYSQTLLRYMQSIHGAAKGASRYAQIISLMEAMAYFAERHKELHVIVMMRKPRKFQTPQYGYSIIKSVMES